MVRWLIFLLGMLTTRAGTSYPAEEGPWPEPGDPEELAGHGPDGTWIIARDPLAREGSAPVADVEAWGLSLIHI